MANGDKKDPLLSSHFTIEFGNVASGYFQEVTGLSSQNEPVEYKAAGPKGQFVIHKIPANPTWGNITLKRGVTDAMDLWEWRNLVEEGKVEEARRDGSIVLYDQKGEAVARWNFERAWPSKLAGPTFNAAANDVAIEEMEIVVEKYLRADGP